MSIEPKGLMMTSRSDDFVPQRPSRPTDNETFYWHPVLGYIRADHARHLYADSARGEEVRNGADCGDGEDRDRQAMGLEDCCGDDCSDGDERREEDCSDCHDDTSASGVKKVEGLLGRGDEDIDEDIEEPEEEPEEPIYTRSDMNRVASAVEGVAERFGNLLEEHRELRQIVKDQQAQIDVLIVALRAKKRDEDLTNEDAPSEDVETEAEDLPPMLN
jgi:hypothetical protein